LKIINQTLIGTLIGKGMPSLAYRISVGKPEGKKPLGRPRRRWEDVKMDLERDRMGWYGLD
jgi:hypothetical protein